MDKKKLGSQVKSIYKYLRIYILKTEGNSQEKKPNIGGGGRRKGELENKIKGSHKKVI